MIYKLGDVCNFYNGGAWSDKEYVDSGLPVLKVTNCKNNGFVLENIDYLPAESVSKYSRNKLQIGDVVIATVGSHPNLVNSAAGRTCIVNSSVEGFYLNQNAVCIRTKNPSVIDQRYLGYLSKSRLFQHYIQMHGRGAASQMRIAISAIKSYEFDFPKLHIQQQIANILSAYDDLIENNQKQIRLLEEAAQRLYKDWFVDFHFPGHETVKVVDGVPEGWKKKVLSEVFDYIRGKSYTSKELVDKGETLMVNLKNIKAFGGYKRNAEKYFTGNFKKEQQLLPGDIVMGVTDMTQERRLVGHVALIPNLGKTMTFSMDLIKLIPKSITRSYLYGIMKYGGYSKKISPLANGVNVLHLKPESMMNLSMIIPTKDVLMRYEKVFVLYQRKIELLQKQCDIAIEARDRLLPRLMGNQ